MNSHWNKQRERSTPFMLRIIIASALTLGRRITRLILYPTVAYFLLTGRSAVRASRHSLQRFLHRPITGFDIARHFFAFAACTLDRIYLLTQQYQTLAITTYHSTETLALSAQSTGYLLLVAHLGSMEILRLNPQGQTLNISILLDRQVGRHLTTLFEQLNPAFASHIIDAAERGPTLVLKLKETLQQGRIVGIAADRARADERTFAVQFMGDTVRLPEGPWALAAALGVPILLGFGLYRGGNRYDLHFELFSERVIVSRQNRHTELHAHAQRYAQRLEHYAQLAPYNWFNFYDYWLDDTHPTP